MSNVKNIYFPSNLKEALSYLKNKNSAFINSGIFSFKNMDSKVENVILAKYLPLRYIKKDKKYLKIGAMSNFDDIDNNIFCKNFFSGFVSKAVSHCSSQLIRNMATVGGNIAHPNAFNIMPVINAVLDAKIVIVGFKAQKIISWRDLYSGEYRIGKDWLISEILFPLDYNKHNFYFEKVSKLKSSWDSYLTIAFRTSVKNQKLEDIRLVFGAIRAIPYVNYEFEKSIVGKILDKELIHHIASTYEKNILNLNPNSSINIYRSKIVKNLIFSYFDKLLEEK